MTVTSHDVARLAGVNQSTVSRALRGAPGVSAETQRRVREAAEALSYVPSDAGRALSTQRTGAVGILSGELTNPFYPELIEPMRQALLEHGYRSVLIPDSAAEPFDADRWARGVFDGMVLTTARTGSDLADRLHARGIPFVFANREIPEAAADRCVSDNAAGAAAVAELLTDLGHTRIAAIMGPADTSTGAERESSFRTALEARGIALPESHIERGEFTFAFGSDAAERLLAGIRPSAIFCANDVLALGAADALHAAGQGETTMLVGYDDISTAARRVYDLTTVHADIPRMGRTAAELLVARIAEPGRPYERVVLPVSLVRRRVVAA